MTEMSVRLPRGGPHVLVRIVDGHVTIRRQPAGQPITIAEVQRRLATIDRQLRAEDVELARTILALLDADIMARSIAPRQKDKEDRVPTRRSAQLRMSSVRKYS